MAEKKAREREKNEKYIDKVWNSSGVNKAYYTDQYGAIRPDKGWGGFGANGKNTKDALDRAIEKYETYLKAENARTEILNNLEAYQGDISYDEYQKLEYYIELFKNDLRIIIYAIEYCKLYKALSIKYLSKILYNWEKAGFKTLEDVKNAEKEKPQVEESTKENEELFDYDWLNDNE